MAKNTVKPYNSGQWTEAKFVSFVKSALRRAQWPPKYEAIKRAFVRRGANPATGRECKLHRCCKCDGLFPQNGVQADHIIPVIGEEGFVDWNTFIARLFCEADGFQVVCKSCHKEITEAERKARAQLKKSNAKQS